MSDLFADQAAAPEPAEQPRRFVEVALNLPVRRCFTYLLPPGMQAQVGNRVRVPFRNKIRPGIVTKVTDQCDFDPRKALPVQTVLDGSLRLPPALLALAERMAAEYGCSLGEALDATVPSAAKRRGKRMVPCLELGIPQEVAQNAIDNLEDKHQAQARVLRTVLEFGEAVPLRECLRIAGTSESPAKTLLKHGMLRKVMVEESGEPLVPAAGEASERHQLNEHQQAAVDAVVASSRAAAHKVFLLHGVTGSGKTEVYLQILEEVRRAGRTAIVLVPEISLTPQTVGRFAGRFPDVAVLHSGLTDAQRGREWQRLISGEASIAIGARSALFAPLQNLGLIVIDEEHEGTFKQESTPRYHARAMAIARGEIENAAVVLGSATPSLESYGKARRGIYELLELPQRAGAGRLPQIVVEDLRGEEREIYVDGVPLSTTLRNLIEERLNVREQVILFLNRRGFSPVLICPSCGTAVKCRHCEVSMTWHVRRRRLVCHYCREERKRPEQCGVCEHENFHDLGIGTERVEAAVKQLFPAAIVARMDADTMAQRGAHERVLSAFRARQVDILIGTQMIAKGLDFPDVTLVGVISADSGLFMPDYRAAERSFQLLYQVAGRAGRADKPGIVVFQTHCPDNYAVQTAARCDYEAFVQQELRFRKAIQYPPFARLIRVLVEATTEGRARAVCGEISGMVRGVADLQVLGPAPAVLTKVKDRFRMHCLAKCSTAASFAAAMEAWGEVEGRGKGSVRVTLDVDPGSLM